MQNALHRVLELLERRPMSATELRILLAVLDGEAAASALARRLDRRSPDIERAAERLYARGLLRWRHDRRRNEPILALTATGLATIRPLLTSQPHLPS